MADVDAPLGQQAFASSFDQGLVNFRHMLNFLTPSFERYGTGPRGRFRIQDSANRATIADRETGAMVRVLGSDPRRLHGAAPKLLLYDEVAQWPPERVEPMLAALKTSRGKIPGSKALWLGTRPSLPDHPFQRALDRHGVGFALCYAAKPDAPPFQRATWKRANPGLDHLPDLEAVIRSEAGDAKRDESATQSFRALRLNQGVADTVTSVLVDADTWLDGMARLYRRGEVINRPALKGQDGRGLAAVNEGDPGGVAVPECEHSALLETEGARVVPGARDLGGGAVADGELRRFLWPRIQSGS